MPLQPPLSRLSPKGLLSFPHRLCNPPPAVGKVRSCSVTPVLNIRLEDVLARRHLPPIGLKDLEEYLLYVEHAPENLYFMLWLKDYTARYQTWAQREKTSLLNKKHKFSSKSQQQKFSVPPTPDPSLAMFYLRAKQTFLTPNGEYELNIPSDILAPFHCAPHTHPQDHNRSSLWHSQSVHPDPAIFSEVAVEVQHMLNESLKRFVRAAYTNVGSQRALCGIIAGCLLSLVSGVLPLTLTTCGWNIGPHERLIRLTAFPGLWFGLTVLIASLQGICLMIYFFGDLRQLRKFELARPTISRPIPIPESSSIPPGPMLQNQSVFIPSRSPPMPEKATGTSPTSTPVDPRTSLAPATRHFTQLSSAGLFEAPCESNGSTSSFGCNEIDISPAFFDDVPAPEGPATASCLHRPEYHMSPPSISHVEPVHVRQVARATGVLTSTFAADGPAAVNQMQSKPNEYGPTAGFISSDYRNNSTTSLSEASKSLRSQRSACYFDFDALPTNKIGLPRDTMVGRDSPSLSPLELKIPPPSSVIMDPSSPCSSGPSSSSHSLAAISSLLGRRQHKCKQYPSPMSTSSTAIPSSDDRPTRFTFATLIPSFTAGVPAFAAPLTPVQSPVVKRAQWEVVVRAAFVAAIVAGALTGVVVGAVP